MPAGRGVVVEGVTPSAISLRPSSRAEVLYRFITLNQWCSWRSASAEAVTKSCVVETTMR